VGPVEIYLEQERGCIFEMDPHNLFLLLMEIPTEMAEMSRRHEFDKVQELIAQYQKLSGAMFFCLENKPTKHISYKEGTKSEAPGSIKMPG
jgi:hypothetical protein